MENNNQLKIVCPFCNAPYSAEMKQDLSESGGCPTCGPGEIEGTIDVICSNCKKVAYRKEIGGFDY